jgi:hypothetical protein
LEADLRKRKLMQTDLVRIEVDELEKKWKALKPMLRSLDSPEKAASADDVEWEESDADNDKENMTASRSRNGPNVDRAQEIDNRKPMQTCEQNIPRIFSSYALEQQRLDYKEACEYWPGYLAKQRRTWKSDGKDVLRKKTNKQFQQASLPTKSASALLSKDDEAIAHAVLEVRYYICLLFFRLKFCKY